MTTPTPAEGAGRLGPLRERMAGAAADWLASLAPAQRAKAAWPFPADEERTRWSYTPDERGGLPLAEMDPVQQRLAHRLLASGLSEGGYATAATIMGLENVLDAREGWRRAYGGRAAPNRGRDPQLYFFSVFGDPGAGSWAWRVGGHHLALNYAILPAGVSASPLFLGANPALTRLVGPGRLRPLAGEEDLARELLGSLDGERRAAAILSPRAPDDITQANRPAVRLWPPQGLAAAAMGPRRQRELLMALLGLYLGRLPDPLAAVETGRALGGLEAVHFGWAGGTEPGQPHYYRLQGPRLHVEYDNVQNGANHVHSVWRDPDGDFGHSSTG